MLNLENLRVFYGGVCALDGVHLQVGKGEFIAIIGPNGAGKTTLFRAISGTVPLQSGTMWYEGNDLGSTPPHLRTVLGIAHIPEGRQIFSSLSILENLEMGAQTPEARREWPRTAEFVYALFPRLAERKRQAAGTLSGGEQQMLAIGRGLASKPRLLLLDEPSMGLAPAVADQIFECIERVHREQGTAILLVEQRVAEALETCDRGYVLESGRIVLEGTRQTLVGNARLKKAYLGL
jgi:branched-chain amino acid transport system ATP-binding protein